MRWNKVFLLLLLTSSIVLLYLLSRLTRSDCLPSPAFSLLIQFSCSRTALYYFKYFCSGTLFVHITRLRQFTSSRMWMSQSEDKWITKLSGARLGKCQLWKVIICFDSFLWEQKIHQCLFYLKPYIFASSRLKKSYELFKAGTSFDLLFGIFCIILRKWNSGHGKIPYKLYM